jgi:hypothetical protein
MPKSKNRKNHSQKVNHQRMINKHRAEKARKENEKKYQEFEKMIHEHRENVAEKRLAYAESLANNDEPTDSEILTKALTEGVILEQQNE